MRLCPICSVKFLFTEQKLWVQVHPSDISASPGEAGKEGCWLVLDAQADVMLAIGFKEDLTSEQMLAAARDGSIEALLEWHPAIPGRFYYLPAGTVHAMGGEITLLETQQASDTTFRLYDYGRPRDLHLERAAAVAITGPYDKKVHVIQSAPSAVLAEAPPFRVERIVGFPPADAHPEFGSGLLAVPLSGQVTGQGAKAFGLGECVYAPSLDALDFSRAGTSILIC